jgi:hypothetical protein
MRLGFRIIDWLIMLVKSVFCFHPTHRNTRLPIFDRSGRALVRTECDVCGLKKVRYS